MTDAEITNWELSEDATENDFHQHFETWGRWHWTDVADEGQRILSVIAIEPLHTYYAIDTLISAVAAQASCGAYNAMAAALGVAAEDLQIAVALWSENQDNLPPPVTAARLMEMIEENRQEGLNRAAAKTA